MRKQRIGLVAENRVCSVLRGYGRSVIKCGYRNPFDLVVDGLRTEVKCSVARPDTDNKNALIWVFNIHRHGVLDEQTDIYILRLEGVPHSDVAIHMLFKAPLGVKTLWISMRALLNQDYAAAVADFYALAKGEYGKKAAA